MSLQGFPGQDQEVDMRARWQTCRRKFTHACTQMNLLDQRIEDCQVRYNRAVQSGKGSFRYNLRLRLAVMTGVKMMFYEYASEMANQLESLRMAIEDPTDDEYSSEES